MQILTKYIADNAVSDGKIRLANTGFLRGRNAANNADINMWGVSSGNQVQAGADVDMDGNALINCIDPTDAQDVATKNYVDSVAQGLSPKEAVSYATAGYLPTYSYVNGSSGVGATLTGTSNGALSIDGTAVSSGQRILVKDEVSGAAVNGIYVVTQTGDVGTPYILTRSLDLDMSSQFGGASVFVVLGSVNSDTQWVCLTVAPSVGTDGISFTQFGSSGSTYTAGNGINVSGSVISATINEGLYFDGGENIAVQTQGLGPSNTTLIDGDNNVASLQAAKSSFTLSSGDISNQYIDLTVVAHTDSIFLQPVGGMPQQESVDYSVSYTGGSGGCSRITFLGGLATSGASALVSGDTLLINCQTLSLY